MPENKYFIFFYRFQGYTIYSVFFAYDQKRRRSTIVACFGYTLCNKGLVFECDPENHYFRDSLAGGNERRAFPNNLRSRPFLEMSNVILLLPIQGRRKREYYRKLIIDAVQRTDNRLINICQSETVFL